HMEQKTRTRSSLFRFKQFAINQAHCTMRINTDGVLLGALARMPSLPPELKEMRILDVGTGTGVIALMLAQRFDEAEVHGIEIDEVSTHTAAQNALLSPFSERMCIFPSALQDFVPPVGDASYSLIVSNPPFFIDALKNP